LISLLCSYPAGHDAVTVLQQGMRGIQDPSLIEVCRREGRILITLDLDFADIRAYDPSNVPGLMVFRVHRQDRLHLLNVLRRVLPLLDREPIAGRLWIIEEHRVRIRGGPA
jgi:predicted nuclease of predicted toxin-antitoxin system